MRALISVTDELSSKQEKKGKKQKAKIISDYSLKSPKPEPLHCFMKLQHKSQRIKMAQREREERKKTGTFFDRLEIDQNFDMLPFRSGIFQSPVLVKFGETQSSRIINTG